MSVRFKNRKSVGNHTVARSRMEAFALPYLEERATQKPTQNIYITPSRQRHTALPRITEYIHNPRTSTVAFLIEIRKLRSFHTSEQALINAFHK